MTMHPDDDDIVHPKPYIELDSGTLYVSIFLLILCLFIVLTSISQIDKSKLEKLSASLTETFSKPQETPETPKEDAALDPSVEFTDLISSWAISLYALEGVTLDRKRSMVLIGIPTQVFFGENETSLRESMLPKLKEMTEMVRKEKFVNRVRMELYVAYTESTSEALRKSSLRRASDRTAAFAKSLEAMNLPPRMLRLGVQEDIEERVFLRFMISNLEAPKNASQEEKKP